MGLRNLLFRWYATLITPTGRDIPFTKLSRPLNQSTIAIVTTAGVRLHNQPEFKKKGGDHTFRTIPGDVDPTSLVPDHPHYNTESAQADIDAVFPIRTLTALARSGVIGKVSPIHIGFMGYIPDMEPLVQESIPAVIDHLKKAGIHAVLLSPG